MSDNCLCAGAILQGSGHDVPGVRVSVLMCGVIPGEIPSGWDVMRELLFRKERSKRKGDEAPSGCNYLPHLNNAFVMIIIERSLRLPRGISQDPAKNKNCRLGDWQGCLLGQSGSWGGGPTALWRLCEVFRRPGTLLGNGDTFPDVALPSPH